MVHQLISYLDRQKLVMDDFLNIKQYFENQKEFMTEDIINFYIEFSKNRLMTQKGTPEFESS